MLPRLLSERSLSLRAAAGDKAAFDEIFRRFNQDVFRYCRSIVRNDQDAMDALQSTMETALAKLPGESREIRLKPWLFRVARNECIDSLNARRAQVSPDGLELESGSSVETTVADRERLKEILSDIGQLPEGQRSALVMRELSGFSFEDIGLALDCSPAAARQVVYEARLSLKELESGRGMLCDEARHAISSMDGRVMRGRKLRAHLRSCEECEDFRAGLVGRQNELRSLVPILPAAAAASILGGIGGGEGGLGGGLLAVFGGGGAATGAGGKAVAIIAVTAGLGAGTAGVVDRFNPTERERGSAVVSEGSSFPGSGESGRPVPSGDLAGPGPAGQPRPVAPESGNENGGRGSGKPAREDSDHGNGRSFDPADSRSQPPEAGAFAALPGPAGRGESKGRGEQAPGRAAVGPPGRGNGRSSDAGRTGQTGPPDHANGRPAQGTQAQAPKKSTKAGVPGRFTSDPSVSSGAGKHQGRGAVRKSLSTP